ncbi:MAG: response regulator [Elusimicrobiales bacterium]|nr:response regulator [Elusimicrobiales bacterium]
MYKILLIEDDAQHILLAKIRLELRGFQVLAAQTGEDGLAEALKSRPDLILLDLILPDMEPAQLITRLRCDPAARKTPIVAFTGLDAFELHRRHLGAEIAEFIPKPYETSELLDKIVRFLGDPQARGTQRLA